MRQARELGSSKTSDRFLADNLSPSFLPASEQTLMRDGHSVVPDAGYEANSGRICATSFPRDLKSPFLPVGLVGSSEPANLWCLTIDQLTLSSTLAAVTNPTGAPST